MGLVGLTVYTAGMPSLEERAPERGRQLRSLSGKRQASSAAVAGRAMVAAVLLSGCAAAPPARAPSEVAAAPPAEPSPQSEGPQSESPPASSRPEGESSVGEPSTEASTVRPDGAIDLDGDDGLDADIAELSASTGGSPIPERGAAASSAREIVYRVTPGGLVIELDGIHLRPVAKPFKDKNGAYGIELTLKADSFDGRQYWLSKPAEGPLSIAGKIESKGGKSTRFSDQRTGAEEEVVMEGASRTFRQRWPGRGQPKLWWGQTVTLEIGLWGVRAESNRQRPVQRLFVVKMVAGNKPLAVITPPTLDWGS